MMKKSKVEIQANSSQTFLIETILIVHHMSWFMSFLEADNTEDSGSDVEVKKRGRRHRLLRHKLSLSEGESGEEKPSNKEKNKESKKSGRKGLFLSLVIFYFVSMCVRCVPVGNQSAPIVTISFLFFQLTVMTLLTQTLKNQKSVKSRV